MATELPDAELVRLIGAAGEAAPAAEGTLFQRYAGRSRVYGRKHLRSDALAEDLAQQVMLKVLEAIRERRVDEPERLTSFIFGACRHVSWDMQRADERQRKIAHETETLHTQVAPPSTSELDVMRLFHCLGQLPEREALVVRMTYMEDREPEEIASRLGASAGNVRVMRCRALAKLKSCVGKELAP